MTARKIGSVIAVSIVLVLLWLVISSEHPAPAAEAPMRTVPASPSPPARAAKECSPPPSATISKESDGVMAEPQWRGGDSLPQRNQHKNQDAIPTRIGFDTMASQMGGYFPIMDRPPATKGEERLYEHYDKKKNAMLHLEGDRANLGVIHMTLFDRIGAPSSRLDTQAEMVRHFLAAAFKDSPLSLGTELEAFLSEPKAKGKEPPKEKSWTVGSNVLNVSTIGGYGMVTLTVTAAERS